MTKSEEEFSRLIEEEEAMFYGFISDSFDSAAANASVEDLAMWAFGDLEAALEAYRDFQKSRL